MAVLELLELVVRRLVLRLFLLVRLLLQALPFQ